MDKKGFSLFFKIKKRSFIIPSISVWGKFFDNLLYIIGHKVFYRGNYYEQLSTASRQCWLESNRLFKQFRNVAIRQTYTEKIARFFTLDPNLLSIKAKQLILKRFQKDFHFSSLVLSSAHDEEAHLIFPVNNRLRQELCSLFKLHSQYVSEIISVIGFVIERLKLFFATIIKTLLTILLFIYWRVTGISKLAREVKGSILWLSGGPGEISLNPEKLSLPLYLKELQECGDFKEIKFSVICPLLVKGKSWNNEHSRSIPFPRHIRPGLSNHAFYQELKDLFKILLYLPLAMIRSDERLELLSLLPHLFLKRAWLKSIPVKAIVISNSCAGNDHALVHAAREMKIPVIMIFYSQNIFPPVEDAACYDIVQNEFEEMLSEYFCVWTDGVKKLLGELGYPSEKIFVVGPQMFAPLMKKKPHKNTGQKPVRVGVVEILPLTKYELVKRGMGKGLYTFEYCLSFLTKTATTVKSVFGDEGLIVLKMKRFVDFLVFDKGWFEERKRFLQSHDGFIMELEPDTNPWVFIDNVDVMVSIPFSSMSDAGLYLGKPSAFFDPSRKILPRLDDRVPLLSGTEDLHCWLEAIHKDNEYLVGRGHNGNPGPDAVAKAFRHILKIQSVYD